MLNKSNVNGPLLLVPDFTVEEFTISSLNMMSAVGCFVDALYQTGEVHFMS